MYDLYQATRYIAQRKIPGSIVECGVFLGGAVMLSAGTLSHYDVTDKELYLYDTFSGFIGEGNPLDINHKGQQIGRQRLHNFVEMTRNNLKMVNYPETCHQFREGDVHETLLAGDVPSEIALLRLDTDTYTTTVVELEQLYPKLVTGGVLIIDDYGYSKGVRKAVDEYFSDSNEALFLQRPNYSSRSAIKI